jgi:hypothetical protein
MKRKSVILSFIPAAILLLALITTQTDWVKSGLGKIGAVIELVKGMRYVNVYAGEGVAGIINSGFDLVHGCDDFLSSDITSSKNWIYIGTTAHSFLSWQGQHQGIISIPSGTTKGVNELIGRQVCLGPSANFAGITKCIARFVVSCDELFRAKDGFDGEWYVGIARPDGTGNVYAGALLSFAPGFDQYPSRELLAGSYTSLSAHTETPTNFRIEPNTWYDLIVCWTPTVIKYYASVYGQTPKLIATNTTNISTEPQFLLVGNNRYKDGSPSVSLLVDKAEWLYTTSESDLNLNDTLLSGATKGFTQQFLTHGLGSQEIGESGKAFELEGSFF